MSALVIRFVVGGVVVSCFALMSDLFVPKTFAGLSGAAPSVALGSLVLTSLTQGKGTAHTEAESMMIGAAALLIYAWTVSHILLKFKLATKLVVFPGLLLWLVSAIGLWLELLR